MLRSCRSSLGGWLRRLVRAAGIVVARGAGLAAALLLLAVAPLAAQQRDTTPPRPRQDTTRAHALTAVVVTGTRLSGADERTPVQVDEMHPRQVAPGPTAAIEALEALPGVNAINDQGTRLQPTLDIRGFTLSPIVGAPQGVSVFLDGVRINEPDAQEVNFDLIPMAAVTRAELVRGPGTLYGKNALAGALLLFTERGQSGHPHVTGQLEGGAWGYRAGQVTASGKSGSVDAYVMARASNEDGWRQDTPARTRMVFANLGHRGDSTDFAFTVLYANDRLKQAGSLPESWYNADPRRNYTPGDYFIPTLWHFAARGHWPMLGGTLRGVAFHRHNATEQFNVNVNAPSNDAFVTNQSNGGTLEWTRPLALGDMALGLTAGADYSRNDVTYRILSIPTAQAPQVDSSCDAVTGVCDNAKVNEDDGAFYLQGVLGVTPRFSITASGRGDWVRIPFRDLRDPANSGTSTYWRFSPRLGVNYTFSEALRGYAVISTGFRAPAPVELACADATAPCPLPYGLGDDPPLHPVTVTDYEGGIDWDMWDGASLDLVGYRENVNDEIVFVASTTTAGYFQNIPHTRRQGVQASVSVRLPRGVRVFGSYGLVDATYQSTVLLASALPVADSARPGDQFPLTPRHRGAVGVSMTGVVGASVLEGTLSVKAVSSQYLRGNDANLNTVALAPGETVSGRIPGYATVNLRLGWNTERFGVEAFVSNLLDEKYANFGILGENPLGPIGGPVPAEAPLERFLNPASPLALTLTATVKY